MEIITGQIAEYNEYRNQVAELVQANAVTIFDYESDKGEKEARSYIYKLRQSKSAIDKKRKELGEDLVARKKLIDGEAKQLIETVESMIDVHIKPLEEKAQREFDRIVKLDELMQELHNFRNVPPHETSSCFANIIDNFNNFIVDERFQERLSEAKETQAKIAEFLINCHATAVEREAEQAEAERLRIEQQAELEALRKAQAEREAKEAAEKAERERVANEERIKREAEQEAQRKANEAAQAKIREAEEAQRKAELEAAKIKQDAIDAENERKRIADLAEQKRVAEEQEKIEAQRKREADIEHRKAINNQSVACFVSEGISEADAKNIVTLIAKGVIANVTINY